MELPPLTRNYFSSAPDKERFYRLIYFMMIALLVILLYFFWGPLRDTGFTYSLVSFTISNAAVYNFFRVVTVLGSEGFFLVFFAVIYWSLNKHLGFWGLVLMPSSIFVTSEVPKDLTRLPRPDVPGVTVPTYTFPSGHTSGAISVWGYLAVMVKRRWFWIFSIVMVALVGLSRTMLGYHFLGDVIGGFVTGALFLALFFWIGVTLVEYRIADKISFRLLMLFVLVIPFGLSFLPALYAPNLMGYLAGAASGYLLERKKINFDVRGQWWQHLARAFAGLLVILLIISGVNEIVPFNFHLLTFTQHAFSTFWITYLAPLLFIRAGLLSVFAGLKEE